LNLSSFTEQELIQLKNRVLAKHKTKQKHRQQIPNHNNVKVPYSRSTEQHHHHKNHKNGIRGLSIIITMAFAQHHHNNGVMGNGICSIFEIGITGSNGNPKFQKFA
jgi:hypothetical protein